uniref:RRM domain-containing protein n=1 Tax=Glycine max TaxID=3847 RepID=K7MMW2_SOYBN
MGGGRDINDVYLQDAMLAANFEPEIEDGIAAMKDTTIKGALKKVTWRNKEDVTTFYFSRFPEGIKEKDLWQIFQKWGKVWEVFIPKSKNKEGHKFGFVRFKEVADEQRLERQLDNNIFIGGMKMFVNSPKFDRGKVFRTNQNGTSTHRMVSIQEVPKGNQEDTKVKFTGGRPRSYVEVAREVILGEGSSYNLKEAPQCAKRATQRPVVLSSNMENNEWLQKAWVGRLKNRGMFERVEEELKWVVDLEVNPCYWANDWIIFPYLDESKAARLINEEMTNGSTPVSELQKWSSNIQPTHRLTWVLLWGLPPTVWEAEYMEKVLVDIGEMVEVDENVEDRRRMDVARILIWTKLRPAIQETVQAIIDGVEYALDVVEDTIRMGAQMKNSRTTSWLPPSPFST